MSVEYHGAMNLITNTMVIMIWKALDDIDLDPDESSICQQRLISIFSHTNHESLKFQTFNVQTARQYNLQ